MHSTISKHKGQPLSVALFYYIFLTLLYKFKEIIVQFIVRKGFFVMQVL